MIINNSDSSQDGVEVSNRPPKRKRDYEEGDEPPRKSSKAAASSRRGAMPTSKTPTKPKTLTVKDTLLNRVPDRSKKLLFDYSGFDDSTRAKFSKSTQE